MKYYYKVIKSSSEKYPEGLEFVTEQKMHDGRKETTSLGDIDCNEFTIKLLRMVGK